MNGKHLPIKKLSQNNTCEIRRRLTQHTRSSRFGRLPEAIGGGTSSDSRGSYRSFASNLGIASPRGSVLDNKATAAMATSVKRLTSRHICCGLRASMPLVGVASVVAGGPIGAAAGLTASAAIAESAKFIANYVTPMQELVDRCTQWR